MAVGNLSNPLEGPTADHSTDGPELKRCAVCGRVGVRQFVTVPATEFNEATFVCQAKAACLARWENAA